MAEAAYDRIGIGYSEIRRPDPRIAARIEAALGEARTVLNARSRSRLLRAKRSRGDRG